jgi:hypothetical protein
VLHTVGLVVTGVFGQLPAILAFHGAEQSLQVGQRSRPRFGANEVRL